MGVVLNILILLTVSCKSNVKYINTQIIEVKNDLDFARVEVVAIDVQDIEGFLKDKSEKNIHIKKSGSEDILRTQWIDYDQNGVADELLFQVEMAANTSETFVIIIDSTVKVSESNIKTYSRFVPERIDDYTWENDKVAFRTYGPAAKQAALDGVPGGVISSGMDIWLKRTDESIIDKWYKKNTEEGGYYHIDHGEGYDPYHVGGSRGTGGIGIWENDSLYVSENFIDHKTIAEGPLRTVFELSYAPWSKYKIKETKRISLDLGSNFSKFESNFSSEKEVPNYVIGITLHENEGEIGMKGDQGWFLHWEIIDDSHVGEGIVVDPSSIDSSFARESKVRDQSNLLIKVGPTDKLIYYAGFAWEKSGQINSKEDWEYMLIKQAKILEQPLKVIVQ